MATAVKKARRGGRKETSRAHRNGRDIRFFNNNGGIVIPSWVADHASYRRWATSNAFPDRGWISYLDGTFWVDLSMEELQHNLLKGKYSTRLTTLTEEEKSGLYLGDNMLVTKVEAGLSTEPDGSYFSFEALRTGRVLLKRGRKSVEIQGSPDMTLEVISPTSVEKDTELLPRLYWRARIQEYWLVDPRGNTVVFDIFRRGPKGYLLVPKRNGWVKSEVFGKSFRLTQGDEEYGLPQFQPEVR